jgi:hypothetical protein
LNSDIDLKGEDIDKKMDWMNLKLKDKWM